MVNTAMIKSRMCKFGVTQADLAKTLNLKQCTVSQKIAGKRSFSLDEAKHVADFLGITSDEFGTYFFSPVLRSATQHSDSRKENI